MCGIVGFNWDDKKLIRKAIATVKHRGPDDQGSYCDKRVSLGHSRLSIIDLSKRGKQPMSNEKGTLWLIYNGEIYNFKELREQLEKKGHKFRSDTDSEVIIHAYEEEGFDCVKKFNGMWAFCIYDSEKKLLFLSRDRVGIKPLYYFFDGKRFVYCSEIKGILEALGEEKVCLDKIALGLYLSLAYIPEPYSIFEKIFKLRKAHNLVFNLKTKKISESRYWALGKPRYIRSSKKIIKDFRKRIDRSVEKRKIADVEVGTFLSGGIDSSAVTATLKKFEPKKLHTFSIGFREKVHDESKYAYRCAKYLNTEHHHYYFTEKDFEKLVDKVYFYYDEPLADYSLFPTFKISELARKYVTVCLSGDGGDELFGGYVHYSKLKQIEFMKKITPRSFRHFGKGFSRTLYKKFKKENLERINRAMRISLMPREKILSGLASGGGKAYMSKEAEGLMERACSKHADIVRASMNWDSNYTLTDDYLVKMDRASMAHALEVRVPLLDYTLVEYANNIPLKLKVDFLRTKKIMKKIVADRIPKENIYKKKRGFTPPLVKWIFTTKKSFCLEKLESLRNRKVVDNSLIDKCISYLRSKKCSGVIVGFIYKFVGLELWFERWEDKIKIED